MQIEKFFDPHLVAAVFTDQQPAPDYRTREGAKGYAVFLAEGLTFWSTIDIIAALTLAFVSVFVDFPIGAVGLFTFFAVGCPAIMVLGIGWGCLQHLTVQETWTIVRDYFRA